MTILDRERQTDRGGERDENFAFLLYCDDVSVCKANLILTNVMAVQRAITSCLNLHYIH